MNIGVLRIASRRFWIFLGGGWIARRFAAPTFPARPAGTIYFMDIQTGDGNGFIATP